MDTSRITGIVLLCGPKADTGGARMRHALAAAVGMLPRADVWCPDGIEWEELRQREGGFEQAYRAAVVPASAVVVVESPDGTVPKGLFTIARIAVAEGRPVLIFRRRGAPPAVALVPVQEVVLRDPDDWTGQHGYLVPVPEHREGALQPARVVDASPRPRATAGGSR